MKGGVRWALLAAVLATCLAAGFSAYRLADLSWNAVVDYRSPYAAAEVPETHRVSAEASRTVLVIIDGLRLDTSRTMGTLRALRGSGRDLELVAPQPSLSYPNWTTILSGAPPYVSGVVTNWHEGEAPVETLFDTARRAKRRTVFVGPRDFEGLYRVGEKVDGSFMLEWQHAYVSDRYVDEALSLAEKIDPSLIVIHLPDVDEAGHTFGGASPEYAATVRRVDADLGRLVNGLQDGSTVFVITADHGHIGDGGHGGWEGDVVRVPSVIAGPGVLLGDGQARLEDIAPTVGALAGVPVPRLAMGASLIATARDGAQQRRADSARLAGIATVFEETLGVVSDPGARVPSVQIARTQATRLAADRSSRVLWFGIALVAAIAVLSAVAVGSRPAFFSAIAGCAGYYATYNLLFFVVHGYRWSLSAFNSEERIAAWMNVRLVEAAVAGLIAAAIAGVVYPFLRRSPKGARGEFLPGWLTLGPTTTLVTLATLGIQVGWFAWWWGVVPTWRLPDLMWGFKYDLDLIQATAIGLTVVLTPLVSYVVGRYHPRVRNRDKG